MACNDTFGCQRGERQHTSPRSRLGEFRRIFLHVLGNPEDVDSGGAGQPEPNKLCTNTFVTCHRAATGGKAIYVISLVKWGGKDHAHQNKNTGRENRASSHGREHKRRGGKRRGPRKRDGYACLFLFIFSLLSSIKANCVHRRHGSYHHQHWVVLCSTYQRAGTVVEVVPDFGGGLSHITCHRCLILSLVATINYDLSGWLCFGVLLSDGGLCRSGMGCEQGVSDV